MIIKTRIVEISDEHYERLERERLRRNPHLAAMERNTEVQLEEQQVMIWRHGPDELPTKGDLVLTYDPDAKYYTIASVEHLDERSGVEASGLYWVNEERDMWPVMEEIYWMPLPEAPQ
jgi:hypothetical protein